QPDQRKSNANRYVARVGWSDNSLAAVDRFDIANGVTNQVEASSSKAGNEQPSELALSHRWSFNGDLRDGSVQQSGTPMRGDTGVTGTYYANDFAYGGAVPQVQRRVESQSTLAGGRLVEAEHEKTGKDLALLADSDTDPRMQADGNYLRLQTT